MEIVLAAVVAAVVAGGVVLLAQRTAPRARVVAPVGAVPAAPAGDGRETKPRERAEPDLQQVNLTRFSLFFPEKRDFFLEGAGNFDFGVLGTGGALAVGDMPTWADRVASVFPLKAFNDAVQGQFDPFASGAGVNQHALTGDELPVHEQCLPAGQGRERQ